MSWKLNNSSPIYLQLIEQITLQILSGKYSCGEHFPSVRELASEAAVNPNTMQKALAQLEQMGLLITSRTNGRTVTTDQSMLERMRQEKALTLFDNFLQSMTGLGFTGEETKNFLNDNSQELAERGIYDSTTSEQSE